MKTLQEAQKSCILFTLCEAAITLAEDLVPTENER